MLHALAELTAAAGLDHPKDFHPAHFFRCVNVRGVLSFAEFYPAKQLGEPIDERTMKSCVAPGQWRAPLASLLRCRRSARAFRPFAQSAKRNEPSGALIPQCEFYASQTL